jgi:5-methylcytosine-specific restriction protein A
MREGRVRRAVVTDHIKDHDGDPVLFRDPDNHQSLCKTCHDQKTRREHAPNL